jgi:hypothetical protein
MDAEPLDSNAIESLWLANERERPWVYLPSPEEIEALKRQIRMRTRPRRRWRVRSTSCGTASRGSAGPSTAKAAYSTTEGNGRHDWFAADWLTAQLEREKPGTPEP